MLTAYRRHLSTCPHRAKGQAYTLCGCPIWCYGTVAGQRIRQSLQTTKVEKALEKIAALERGEDLPDRAAAVPTVSETCERFLKVCEGRNVGESTIDSYRNTLKHLKSAHGDLSIAAITPVLLDAYRASRKVKASTWRKELETLRALFTFAVERGWLKENPGRKIRMPQVEELVTQPFQTEEIRALIAACDSIETTDPGPREYVRQRARALVYTLLYSGLRISDVAALKRKALERSGHLVLRTQKNGVPVKVLLHQNAQQALKVLPAQHPDYFFWTGNGDIITAIKNMRRTVQRLGAIADVHAHPHRFRDTFAVELLTAGADIRTVQKLLGHRSVRTTERHYAHFVAAHQALLDSAASRLDFEANGKALPYPVKDVRRNAK